MTYRTPLAIALLTLALAGCGDDDNDPPAVAAATPVAAEAPYGTYTRTVTAADLKRTADERPDYGPGQGPPPKGEHRLTLAKGANGDELRSTGPDGFAITMYLEAEEGLLELPDYVDVNDGTFCGPEVPIEASYRYQLDGDTLTLEPSPPDACADRDAVLTGTWSR